MAMKLNTLATTLSGDLYRIRFQHGPNALAARFLRYAQVTNTAKIATQCKLWNKV